MAGFLWGALWQRHKWKLVLAVGLQAIYGAALFSGPILLSKIVTFLGDTALYNAQQGTTLVRARRDVGFRLLP